MSPFVKYIRKTPYFLQIVTYLKSIYFKGAGANLYEVIIIFISKLQDNQTKQRAYAVAFNFTLAVFPAIIFLFTLIAYVPDLDVGEVMRFMESILPTSFYAQAEGTIYDIISKERGGLLSFGFITALYLATSGMTSLIDTFNTIYHAPKKRTFFREKWLATLLTLYLALVLIIAIFLLIAGNVILKELVRRGFMDQNFIYYLLETFRFIVVALMFFSGISMIYYYGPRIPVRWKFFSPGTGIATILSVFVSGAFSYYIDHFGTYNRLYGSIGAMIGFMFWLFALSLIILIGFEINATLDLAKEKNSKILFEKKN
ncbi:MAG: YihY/virulence factor BrkB family protein [Bacteroidota bacterium]